MEIVKHTLLVHAMRFYHKDGVEFAVFADDPVHPKSREEVTKILEETFRDEFEIEGKFEYEGRITLKLPDAVVERIKSDLG